jgi:solute carrier family 6 noradrenalin transporter-like protein 2
MEKQDFASVTVFTENTLEKTDTDGSSTSENTSAHHHPRYCNPDDPFDCHPRWKDAHFRQRPIWFHKADPILTHIAFAVDFANVAAFSYLSVAYGGPAFLVPYFFFLVVCAFPILYMEVVLGQFLREGLISVWKIVPILKGIGYSLTMIITTLMMYYLTPVAWALVYLSGCFEEPLPWIHCDHPWNTIKCTTIEPDHFFSNNKTDLDPKKPTPAHEYFK